MRESRVWMWFWAIGLATCFIALFDENDVEKFGWLMVGFGWKIVGLLFRIADVIERRGSNG